MNNCQNFGRISIWAVGVFVGVNGGVRRFLSGYCWAVCFGFIFSSIDELFNALSGFLAHLFVLLLEIVYAAIFGGTCSFYPVLFYSFFYDFGIDQDSHIEKKFFNL